LKSSRGRKQVGLFLDFSAEFFNLGQRAFRHHGEEARVFGEDFQSQDTQRVVHGLKLLNRLGESGFLGRHGSILNTPLVASGNSRDWL
jgi:hypothetical protein